MLHFRVKGNCTPIVAPSGNIFFSVSFMIIFSLLETKLSTNVNELVHSAAVIVTNELIPLAPLTTATSFPMVPVNGKVRPAGKGFSTLEIITDTLLIILLFEKILENII